MLFRRLRLLLLIGSLWLTGALTLNAQETPTPVPFDELTYSSLTPLRDLLPETASQARISPDGTRIAYMTKDPQAVCTFVIETGDNQCAALPEDIDPGADGLLWSIWSAQGDRFAMTFYHGFLGDYLAKNIVIYDVAANTVRQVMLDPITVENREVTPHIQAIMWHPDGSLHAVLFERTSDFNINPTLGIYRIGDDLASVESVYRRHAPDSPLYIQFRRGMQLDGMLTYSPDGTRLALVLADPDNPIYPENGVYVIDLETGTHERVILPTELAEGLPFDAIPPDARHGFNFDTIGLAWDSTGSGLYAYGLRFDVSFFLASLIHKDLTTGRVSPMIPLNGKMLYDEIRLSDALTVFPDQLYPQHVSVAPARDGVIITNALYMPPVIYLLGSQPHPAGGAIFSLLLAQKDTLSVVLDGSVGANGNMIVAGYLLRNGD